MALPRLLEVFKRHGVRATFFVVGRDAATHQARFSALAQQGHVVYSPSHGITDFTVPQFDDFARRCYPFRRTKKTSRHR